MRTFRVDQGDSGAALNRKSTRTAHHRPQPRGGSHRSADQPRWADRTTSRPVHTGPNPA